jgi:hypothetical protein
MPDAPLITFVLSGGVTNQDPNLSLGGPPSPTPVDDVINNLFADVTGKQVEDGYTDYRCFYIFNDSTDDFADFKVWIDSQSVDGATCDLGIIQANEMQDLTFINVSGGTFQLSLDGHVTGDIAYAFDPTILATNILLGLRKLPNATQVEVTFQGGNSFRVEWKNLEKNKRYPLLILSTNNLEQNDPLQPATIVIEEFQAGTPINAIAPDIGIPTSPPAGVVFSQPGVNTPLEIGVLKPSEGFSLWLRRTTEAETQPTPNDGLVIKCTGDRVIGGVNA